MASAAEKGCWRRSHARDTESASMVAGELRRRSISTISCCNSRRPTACRLSRMVTLRRPPDHQPDARFDGWHGRRVLVNGQKIFCRGGYIQPELMLDWVAAADRERNPLLCRRQHEPDLLRGHSQPAGRVPGRLRPAWRVVRQLFLCCSWVPPPDRPQDLACSDQCTADLFKRYRNHPSLVMYMAMNEGYTCRKSTRCGGGQVARSTVRGSGSPSAYFPDFLKGSRRLA